VCASAKRAFASTDKGQTWLALPEIPGGRLVGLKAMEHGALAATDTGVFLWTATNSKWTKLSVPEPVRIRDLFTESGDFAALQTDAGLLLSDDSGNSWFSCPGVPHAGDIHSVAGMGGEGGFIVAGWSGGLMRSDDRCRTWTPAGEGLGGDTVSLVAIESAEAADGGQSLLAFAIQFGRLFVSSDRGQSWNALSDGGRFGSFPLALRVAGMAREQRLVAVFGGTGVMVHELINRPDASGRL
jgi:hypothetical protein